MYQNLPEEPIILGASFGTKFCFQINDDQVTVWDSSGQFQIPSNMLSFLGIISRHELVPFCIPALGSFNTFEHVARLSFVPSQVLCFLLLSLPIDIHR